MANTETQPENRFPTGIRLLTIKQICEKLSVKRSSLWSRIKTDKSFPPLIYISPKEPRAMEHEVDAYIAAKAAAPCKPMLIRRRRKSAHQAPSVEATAPAPAQRAPRTKAREQAEAAGEASS